MKTPKEIIAYNLPTWFEWYRFPPTKLPNIYDLNDKAAGIIKALELEGYEIKKVDE